jgi:hypothetical protein
MDYDGGMRESRIGAGVLIFIFAWLICNVCFAKSVRNSPVAPTKRVGDPSIFKKSEEVLTTKEKSEQKIKKALKRAAKARKRAKEEGQALSGTGTNWEKGAHKDSGKKK